jgi:hypothetical protein
LVALPQITGLRQSLETGFEYVLGFGRLEIDVAEVAASASYALHMCQVLADSNCRFYSTAGNSVTVAPQLRIQKSYERTLQAVLEVATDRYLGTPNLKPIASQLTAIASNISALTDSSVPCTEAAPIYCAVYLNADAATGQVPSARAEADRFVDGIMEIVHEDVLHLWVYLHILSPMSVIAMLLFHCKQIPCCASRKNGKSMGTRCLRYGYRFQWLLRACIVLVSLAISVVGFEIAMDLGLLCFTVLNGSPTLATVTDHVQLHFPLLWDIICEGKELQFQLLWFSAISFLWICIITIAYDACVGICSDRSRISSIASTSKLQEDCSYDRSDVPGEELAELLTLEPCQRIALENVHRRCRALHLQALPKLQKRVRDLGFSSQDLEVALTWMRRHVPIIVHIDVAKVGAHLANDSHYRNQFETSISGGTLDHAKRKRWEDSLFEGAYSAALPFDRCKYGVLNVTNDPQGVRTCLQYGLSYLLLRGVRSRTTFCSTDSAGMHSEDLATVDSCAHVFDKFTDAELRCVLEVGTQRVPGKDSQLLRSYKEAQVHGEIRLAEHIELIMAHPSLHESPHLLASLTALANCCKCPVVWIEGGIDTPTRLSGGMMSVPVRLPSVPLVPGQAVEVEVPGGQIISMIVPPGARPGQQITVQYPQPSPSRIGASTPEASLKAAALASTSDAPDVWEVQGNDGWSVIQEPAISKIQRALAEGSRVARYEACGNAYELDFDLGVQRNLASGRQRLVRRRARHAASVTVPIPRSL